MAPWPAVLNAMRLNNARLNYYAPRVYLTINGTRREQSGARLGSVRVTKRRGSGASSATMVVQGFTPSAGQEVLIGVGTLNNRLFGGVIQRREQIHEGKEANIAWNLTCVGYRWLLDRRLVWAAYENQNADAIVRSLVSTYTSGFTTAHVQAAMPTVASIVFNGVTVGEAIDRLKELVEDADWYVDDYKDVHFFAGIEALVQPRTVTNSGSGTVDLQADFISDTDLSQIRTRVFVAGTRGSLADLAAVGATTLVVDDTGPFFPDGGSAITDGLIVTYTGIGEASTVAAPGAPTAALGYYDIAGVRTITAQSTGGGSPQTITMTVSAAHGWAVNDFVAITGNTQTDGVFKITAVTSTTFSFVINGGGTHNAGGGSARKCIGALTFATQGGICTVTTAAAHGLVIGQRIQVLYVLNTSSPSGPFSSDYRGVHTVASVPSTTTFTIEIAGYPSDAFDIGNGNGCGGLFAASSGRLVGSYTYKAAFAVDAGESLASAASGSVSPAVVATQSAAGCSYTPASGGSLTASSTYIYAISAVTDEGDDTGTGTTQSVVLGVGETKVTIGIPNSLLNDPRIRALSVWRTRSNQSASDLRYVGSVSPVYDGTALAFIDTIADGSLGALYVSSGNQTGGGVAVSGVAVSSNGRVTSRNIYRTAAGGSTYKRTTTVDGNVSTSCIDTLSDTDRAAQPDEPTIAAAFPGTLTGVSGVTRELGAGTEIRPRVQRDDTAAQTALAALVGGDGIHEHPITVEEARTKADLEAAGDADLARFSTTAPELRFASRDDHFLPGVVAPVNMPSPTSVSGDFLVQEVVIDELQLVLTKYPLRKVTAAAARFTLSDFLRSL